MGAVGSLTESLYFSSTNQLIRDKTLRNKLPIVHYSVNLPKLHQFLPAFAEESAAVLPVDLD